MSIFNERFFRLHKSGGLSQTGTAEKIYDATGVKIPQTTLSDYLHRTEPDISIAAAIAKTYNVSLEWLAGMTDDKQPLSSMVRRISEMTMSPDVERAARLIAQMPEIQQNEIVSMVIAKHKQWQATKDLIEVVRQFDGNGVLSARIAELAGLDIRGPDAVSEFISDNLFSNGDTHSGDQQVPINIRK